MRALVTGGSSGIGLAAARVLGEGDGRVALLARDATTLQAAADQLGAGTIWVAADVAEAAQVKAAVEDAVKQLDGLDVVVAAAGFGIRATTETPYDESVSIWDNVVGVNLRGAFLTMQAAAPHLPRPGGRIITISSIAAYTGGSVPGAAAYAAAKAGLLGLTRGFARELTPHGITVNAIAPGFIATDFHGDNLPHIAEAMIDQIPAGRAGQPDDVAATVAFPASPGAAYISGEVIHVNGGWLFGG